MAPRIILCLNRGSSSLKFTLFELGDGVERLAAEGAAEGIGLAQGRLWVRDPSGKSLRDARDRFTDRQGAVRTALTALEELRLPRPAAVGHRLVHGGPDHTAPERLTPALLQTLRRLIPLAPLHLPGELQVIKVVTDRHPDLPQVVCFDTAFHRRMPELAQRLPLPRALWDEGVRRYGFHGLSYEYILDHLGVAAASGRLIIAHLGNGASMAAVRDGRPLDTTMGFTPMGGFMMGTRSGDLDPGVLIYLLTAKRYDTERLERLVEHESGLLGVSGISPDMKTLLDARPHEPYAAQAVAMFCYQVRKHIGALTGVLGGLDALVFSGGIGERASAVRSEVCRGLEYLGIRVDPGRNTAHADLISPPDSPCAVRVVRTNEDLMIARHTARLVFPTPDRRAAGP